MTRRSTETRRHKLIGWGSAMLMALLLIDVSLVTGQQVSYGSNRSIQFRQDQDQPELKPANDLESDSRSVFQDEKDSNETDDDEDNGSESENSTPSLKGTVEDADNLSVFKSNSDQLNQFDVTLEQMEQLVITSNPSVQQMQSQIEALRGKRLQRGLSPNPVVGLAGNDINEEGTGGRYGVFFGREVVRGNKLQLSQSVVGAEIEAAQNRLAISKQQLVIELRKRYYNLLVAQEKMEVAIELKKIFEDALSVSEALFEAEEVAKTAVLQSELELQNAIVVQRQSENQVKAHRRKLAALFGEHDLAQVRLQGNPRAILDLDEFEAAYQRLIDSSPELATVFADVEQARRQLDREMVEPIPNMTWQANLQLDTVSDNLVGGFQFGWPIPTRNCNQGNILQAQHNIIATQRKAEQKVLELRNRLASAYQGFIDAKLQIDAYDTEILPKAKETFQLIRMGYQEREVGILQLLTAQRTYSQIILDYLDQLQTAWQYHSEIQGLLTVY